MRKFLFVFTIIFLISCSSGKNTKGSVKQDTNYEANNMLHQSKDIPNYKIIDTIKVYTRIKIQVHSIDSIIADVIFFNDQNTSVTLYRPILPSDSLSENTFSILDSKNKNLQHIVPFKDQKYLFGSQRILPGVIPRLEKNNLIKLLPGEKLSYSINLAKQYNFKQTDRKLKSRDVYVGYVNLFPYIVEEKQVFVPYTENGMNGERPVYFLVESKNNQMEAESVKIVLPL